MQRKPKSLFEFCLVAFFAIGLWITTAAFISSVSLLVLSLLCHLYEFLAVQEHIHFILTGLVAIGMFVVWKIKGAIENAK